MGCCFQTSIPNEPAALWVFFLCRQDLLLCNGSIMRIRGWNGFFRPRRGQMLVAIYWQGAPSTSERSQIRGTCHLSMVGTINKTVYLPTYDLTAVIFRLPTPVRIIYKMRSRISCSFWNTRKYFLMGRRLREPTPPLKIPLGRAVGCLNQSQNFRPTCLSKNLEKL